jgi:hypothetical protein
MLVCALIAGLVLGLSPVQAQSERLPFITGGGRTENNNSGGEDQYAYGGFVARAVEGGTTSSQPVFGSDVTTYPAQGQVQARSATVAGNETVIKVHGTVVCIADYGPSSEVDGGGNPDEDVWEVRFEITKSDPPGLEGGYASIMVQDNGRDDYADENAASSFFANPNCGNVTQFQLEPVDGQITVHE